MGINTELIDIRVIVEVNKGWSYRPRTPAQLRSDCVELVKSIKRHVDDVESCYVDEVYEDQCEFCGDKWTESSRKYNGGCCDKDEENNPENAATTQA